MVSMDCDAKGLCAVFEQFLSDSGSGRVFSKTSIQ